MSGACVSVRVARFGELDASTLYALLRLRIDVFVVEQECPYPDLDGRDLEPSTRHLWTADEAGPAAYLRVLDDRDRVRIGRVCTRADARGRGQAATLMAEAVRLAGGHDVVLHAQTYVAGWYERFGFTTDGPDFVEDGIPHRPMRRCAM